jgi:phosphoglycerate dehydrogenase-like enzyme
VLCTALSTETGPHLDLLSLAGFDVRQAPRDQNLYDDQTLFRIAGGVDAVIAGSEPWPRWVLEGLPQLRVLSRTGVGYDAIDMSACDDCGVVVATTPGVNHHAVAEHTIALLMGIARGFPRRDAVVRNGTWPRFSTSRVMGRTLGIVGLGRIGRAVATRAVGLGLKVIACDPYAQLEFAEQWGIELTTFPELLGRADYVSLHLPLNQGTRHLINTKTLAVMKPGSVLLNTARGALVDEPALIAALQAGHLRAAGLDVFEQEPLPLSSPLLQMDNVLLSGHVAGLDNESQYDTLTMAADTIIQLSGGKWPAERIRNLAGITGWTWQRDGQ